MDETDADRDRRRAERALVRRLADALKKGVRYADDPELYALLRDVEHALKSVRLGLS